MHMCRDVVLVRLSARKQAACCVPLVASAKGPTAMRRRSLLAGIAMAIPFSYMLRGVLSGRHRNDMRPYLGLKVMQLHTRDPTKSTFTVAVVAHQEMTV